MPSKLQTFLYFLCLTMLCPDLPAEVVVFDDEEEEAANDVLFNPDPAPTAKKKRRKKRTRSSVRKKKKSRTSSSRRRKNRRKKRKRRKPKQSVPRDRGGLIDLDKLDESGPLADIPVPESPLINDGVVDLDAIDALSTPPRAPAEGERPRDSSFYSRPSGAGAAFKVVFDLLLHVRPGISPLSFDNYHTVLLVDYIPNPKLRFSFAFAPQFELVPKYFEFAYNFTPSLQFRIGRIMIPFDEMDPHSRYGGYIGTSSRRFGTVAFLPDIWADYGVGAKYEIDLSPTINLEAHGYAVNGFQEGGTDPIGEVGSVYPNFSNTLAPDNNADKALGARVKLTYNNFLSLAGSVYTGRYTNDERESQRVLMYGVDGSLRLKSKTAFSFGYLLGNVGLNPPATELSYNRAGLYFNASQRVLKDFNLVFNFGKQQADNRLEDENDLTLVGGAIQYLTPIFQVSLEYIKDIDDVPAKINREFTGIRFSFYF